jgi:hypothetical protein
MSQRRKNRNQPRSGSTGQANGPRPSAAGWGTNPRTENHVTDGSKIWVVPPPVDHPTPPHDEGPDEPRSGYDSSRRNAITHGMRCQTVFPDEVAVMVRDRFEGLMLELKPRTPYEVFCVGEIARNTVFVEIGAMRLLQDEMRIVNRLAGPDWESDARERAERLAQRLPRYPHRTARALERTKQGTELLIEHLQGLADVVQSKGELDAASRTMLFDLVAVPLPLRDGARRVPAADDGPGLAALIAQEIKRHQSNLTTTLNQRDRDDRMTAMKFPSTYNDRIRRQLRSDEARAHKRLAWAQAMFDQLRKGAAASSIIDPRTSRPINPDAQEPPAPRRAPASAPPPQPPPPSDEETSPEPPRDGGPRIPDEWPDDIKQTLSVASAAIGPLRAMIREQMARSEPPPPA